MDKVYILVLLLMIIPILICIKYAGKVKSEVASSIVKCLVLMIITILSNGVFVLSDNQLFSYVMEGLYLFSFDVLLIYILQYSQQYTQVFSAVSYTHLDVYKRQSLYGIVAKKNEPDNPGGGETGGGEIKDPNTENGGTGDNGGSNNCLLYTFRCV